MSIGGAMGTCNPKSGVRMWHVKWLSHSSPFKKPPRQYIYSICWCVINITGWRSTIRTTSLGTLPRGETLPAIPALNSWLPVGLQVHLEVGGVHNGSIGSRCHDSRVSLGVVSGESGLIYLPRNLSSTEPCMESSSIYNISRSIYVPKRNKQGQ